MANLHEGLARAIEKRLSCSASNDLQGLPAAHGQSIAYIYAKMTEAEAVQAKVLTMDEARRVAANIAKLPKLLGAKREE